MELVLQIILLIGTSAFSVYIINKVRIKKLELQYSLIWLFVSGALFLLALFPNLIKILAGLISVQDDVNALFLVIIFFILLIVFSITSSLSDKSKTINILVQEIGLLKHEVNKIKIQNKKSNNNKEESKSWIILQKVSSY